MPTLPKVLLIEDSPSLASTYQHYLANEAIVLTVVTNGEQAKESIRVQVPDLILLDLKLPDISGQEVLVWIKEHKYPSAVVVMTAYSSIDIAVEIMQLGAQDFLQKPIDAARIRTTVKNVLEKQRLTNLITDIQDLERRNYHGFIGSSLPMQAVYRIIDAASSSKATIFITGESGTGKEVCAKAIHQQSPRSSKPFIALNCGAIPKDLMESEVFGHIKGSFTGALNERLGAASLADGGTLFLDEICEMDLDLQTKLLRFVQSGTFQKVGSGKQELVDIRIICATNKDPFAEVNAGNFREDLYYRLHVVPIQLPPLRERGHDILELSNAFLEQFSGEEHRDFKRFSPEVEQHFLNYPWPGNIRELQNTIRNVVVLHNEQQVELSHLPIQWQQEQHSVTPQVANKEYKYETEGGEIRNNKVIPLAQVEKEAIEEAIAQCTGNIPKAAVLLEVSPSTIYRKKMVWDEL
ncbi:sigma-54-dependent transcriptional regulator [Aliivibrio kagoshimensis]|uniref:sigma-54-dependent transcriptional regulator n=1 Tax=Aliivibrio kagoshimensis TaxID=2910230 RepID=UPI003D0B29C7